MTLRPAGRSQASSPSSLASIAVRLVAVAAMDAAALYVAQRLLVDGEVLVAGLLLGLAFLLSVVYLVDRFHPVRWFAPGLALLTLFVLYPVVNTGYIALTNYGDGHILTKEQALGQLLGERFTPADAPSYLWTAYRSADGRFLLLLRDDAGNAVLTAEEGVSLPSVDPAALAGDGPAEIDAFRRLARAETVRYLSSLEDKRFLASDGTRVNITSLSRAAAQQPRYRYDAATDQLTDLSTGVTYTPRRGNFTAPDGTSIQPGFAAPIGIENYTRILENSNIREPFVRIFLWTFAFAALSVLTAFGLGLAVAIALDDKKLPLRGPLRAANLLPYTLPIFITAPLWVGLLNPTYGPVTGALDSLFGISPNWLGDPTMAKVALLLVNLWLGFPYMMVICLGALQSIPDELNDAATIDGAGIVQRTRFVTLPLLLVSVGPLLVGGFAFSFNNFAIVELLTQGGPPDLSSASPAGHTDILISYTYRLAFTTGRGADHGLAAAVSVLIFLLVAVMTIVNFRLTRQFEEIGEHG